MRHDEGKTPTIHRAPPRPPGAATATFAVQHTYTDDADRLAPFRPEHRAHLPERQAEGSLLLPGPPGEHPGGLPIVTAESGVAALAAGDGDPFTREGVITARTAREWAVVIAHTPGS